MRLTWPALTTYDSWGGYKIHAYELWWEDVGTLFEPELLYTDTPPYTLTYTHTNSSSDPNVGNTVYLT